MKLITNNSLAYLARIIKQALKNKSDSSHTHSNYVTNDELTNEVNTLKKSVSDGKSKVATAITNKGVATSATASFDVMSSNIQAIKGEQIMFAQNGQELCIICKDNAIAEVTGNTLNFKPYKKFYFDGKNLNIYD